MVCRLCHRRRQLFRMTSLNPLGRFKLNCMWSLSGMGEYYSIHKVWVILPSWPHLVYPTCDSWSPKFVQMVILSWRLTYLRKGQIDIPMYLHEKNIEKSLFRGLLKTGVSSLAQILYWARIRKYINMKVSG